jgi:hypothetical protein
MRDQMGREGTLDWIWIIKLKVIKELFYKKTKQNKTIFHQAH